MPTNDGKTGEYRAPSGDVNDYPESGPGSSKLGYETTDVNVQGVAVFLGGLFGFVLIFFFFCFFMGRMINNGLNQQDGPNDKWHQLPAGDMFAGAKATGGKRENLKSNGAIEQQELQEMTRSFPGPRLQTDDGNQDLADLHAREDLLLNHYSRVPGENGIRIPIDRAMEIIARKGLPVSSGGQPAEQLAGDGKPAITPPLTSGFARTGYELDTIEARAQRMSEEKPTGREHAELHPVR